MQFFSTKNPDKAYSFSQAIEAGLANDGGLLVPEYFPNADLQELAKIHHYPSFATQILRNYIDSPLAENLEAICQQAFNFDIPMVRLDDDTHVVELFHGPTLSFKDVGARFLAQCLAYSNKPLTIMVATSGDTGSAVAAAFHQTATPVIVLFPKGKISARQQQQITCWGDNITAVAINGDFDDCQRLVKAAFSASNIQSNRQLSTSNSINIGRLLPQMVYYAYHSLHYQRQHQRAIGVIVPSGNLGNVTAAYWAKQMGFPIREIVIATNANRPVMHYLQTGEYQAFATVNTLANAMDVGNPSNFARLQHLLPDFAQFKAQVSAIQVSDQQIQQGILTAWQQHQMILCPHTATAYVARQQLDKQAWMLMATADPCKFETVIEPIIKQTIPVAKSLRKMLDKPQQFVTIAADLKQLLDLL